MWIVIFVLMILQIILTVIIFGVMVATTSEAAGRNRIVKTEQGVRDPDQGKAGGL